MSSLHRPRTRSLPDPARWIRWAALGSALAASALIGCGDGTGPGDLRLTFSESELAFGATRASTVTLTNAGGGALGPVLVTAAPVQGGGGGTIPGAQVGAAPEFVSTLAPGESVEIAVTVSINAAVAAGTYTAELTAAAGTDASAGILVTFDVTSSSAENLESLSIAAGPTSSRQGDVVQFAAQGVDTAGTTVDVPDASWSVSPASAGLFTATGQFVAYQPGTVTVMATAGGLTATQNVTVSARGLSGGASIVGTGPVTSRFTSDLWVHDGYAYTGTWNRRTSGGVTRDGNVLYAWDVSNAAAPSLTDSVMVDARTVNDVKVHPDGSLGLITHEGSTDGLNGITLLDLSNPASPSVITRFTDGLSNGVHNAWLDGDHAYLVVDGAGGLRVLDVSNPASPSVAASFYGGGSFLHDVYVRDGLAFLSHWGVGLIIMDVGNGIAGGSPANPVELSRMFIAGETHNAWYWPERGYVFVGEEDFGTPGMMHVLDVSNLRAPRQVATFAVPGTTPHNFWLDESLGVLYLAWYDNGLRALDVGGDLLGDLGRQGREIFGAVYNGGHCDNNGTCTWAPQLVDGRVWVSDMNAGLIALDPSLP